VSVVAPPRKRAPKKNTALIVVASVVAIALVAVLLANLADSGSNKQAKKKTQPTTPAATSKVLTLRVGEVKVQNTGAPAKVKPPVRKALLNVTQGYVNNPGVKRAAARTDRAVLTEVRSGVATGPVVATATPVRIDALGDPTGKIALAAATFTLRIKAPTAKGTVNIRRRTELTFANEFGKWVVTAYRVSVRRSLGAKTASSSASTSSPIGTTS